MTDRDELIDSAALRIDSARSLLIGDALTVAKLGRVTDNILRDMQEHAEAYEAAKYEHRTLLFGETI